MVKFGLLSVNPAVVKLAPYIPPTSNTRIDEDGETRVIEDGEIRIIED